MAAILHPYRLALAMSRLSVGEASSFFYYHGNQMGLARMEKIVLLCFLVAIIGAGKRDAHFLSATFRARTWQRYRLPHHLPSRFGGVRRQ